MTWESYDQRVINLNNARETDEVRRFLAAFGLSFDEQAVEFTIAFYRGETMIATGSLAGEVLRNIAVDPACQGADLAAGLVSRLMQEAGQRGRYHYFIYTKPDKAHLFAGLGFAEIGRAEPYAALLEAGMGSVGAYGRELAGRVAGLPAGPRAALVVNCNPFTLGHRALIARAAAENAAVVVLVVEEDRSLFPFAVRLRLVTDGLADLGNVRVLPGGKYIISAATFPGYFTRDEETVAAQTRLDADIFARHIAPALGVTRRYVGEEPYCAVTDAYNQALSAVLPPRGIEVRVVTRLAVGGEAVSASRVRELIRRDDWQGVEPLVPPSTWAYLRSPAAAAVIAKIKGGQSRH